MEITSVKVRVFEREGSKVKGFASVTLDEEFVVNDIRIVEGENGLFIAMPSKKKPNGEFTDICHPTCQEVRDKFHNAILEEYQKVLENPAE